MQTNWDSPFSFVRGADFSETAASFAGDYGLISNDPGTWEMTAVAIPEPSTFVLLALPLLLVHARATGRRIA
jgi:hypothetical protein